MKTISASASKLAFLSLIWTGCAAFLYEVIRGVATLEAKDFMVLAGAASAFYFAYKPSKSQETGTSEAQPEFGGK